MEILESLNIFAQAISDQLLLVAGVAVLLIGMLIASLAANNIGQNEKAKRFTNILSLIREQALSLIILLDADDLPYNVEEYTQRAEALPFDIDPRMLYVTDRVEQWFAKWGYKIDFEQSYEIAQSVYRQWKHK